MLIVEPEQALLPWNLRGVINVNGPFKSCVTATSTPSNLKTQDNISKNEDKKMVVKASKMYEIRRISWRQKSRPRRQNIKKRNSPIEKPIEEPKNSPWNKWANSPWDNRLIWRLAEKSSSHRERRCYWAEPVQPERPHDGCKLSSSSQPTDCSIVLDPTPKFCRQPGLNHLVRIVHGRTPVDAMLNPSSHKCLKFLQVCAETRNSAMASCKEWFSLNQCVR